MLLPRRKDVENKDNFQLFEAEKEKVSFLNIEIPPEVFEFLEECPDVKNYILNSTRLFIFTELQKILQDTEDIEKDLKELDDIQILSVAKDKREKINAKFKILPDEEW